MKTSVLNYKRTDCINLDDIKIKCLFSLLKSNVKDAYMEWYSDNQDTISEVLKVETFSTPILKVTVILYAEKEKEDAESV